MTRYSRNLVSEKKKKGKRRKYKTYIISIKKKGDECTKTFLIAFFFVAEQRYIVDKVYTATECFAS